MTRALKYLTAAALVAGISFVQTQAHAWTGTTIGTVDSIQLGDNASFSFALVGGPAMCGTGLNTNARGAVWVGTSNGVTITTDAMKAMLSLVMAAKLSGREVRVYAENNTNPQGGWGCRVGAIDLR